MVVCVVMVTQQIIGLLTDVRQMKDRIKETRDEQNDADIQ